MRYYVWVSREKEPPIIVEIDGSASDNCRVFEKHFPGKMSSNGGSYVYFWGGVRTLKESWNEVPKKYETPGYPFRIKSVEDEQLVWDMCLIIKANGELLLPYKVPSVPNAPAPGLTDSQARAAAWGKQEYVAREGAPFEFL